MTFPLRTVPWESRSVLSEDASAGPAPGLWTNTMNGDSKDNGDVRT